jgi:hypothetical protein
VGLEKCAQTHNLVWGKGQIGMKYTIANTVACITATSRIVRKINQCCGARSARSRVIFILGEPEPDRYDAVPQQNITMSHPFKNAISKSKR